MLDDIAKIMRALGYVEAARAVRLGHCVIADPLSALMMWRHLQIKRGSA